MTRYKIVLAVILGFGLGGCTATPLSWSGAVNASVSPRRIVLVQAPIAIADPRLRKLFAPDVAKDSPASQQAIQNAVDIAQTRALAYMQSALESQTGIRIINSATVSRVIDKWRIDNADTVVTPEIAERLRAVSGADAILRFHITDYGVTPKAWRKAVITFEVVSTLGIAAFAYAKPATRALAGVYLVTEAIEETAEAYGGFWALDEICRPVRIEAQLITFDPETAAWKTSATGLSDRRVTRLVRKVSVTERDTQLDNAVHNAVNGIVADLQR